jgi:3-phosphoglycerate kinase
MVNVPHNKSESIQYTSAIRKNVDKIHNVENRYRKILLASTLSPIDIENQTSSLADHYMVTLATINLPHFYDMLIFRQVLKICFL